MSEDRNLLYGWCEEGVSLTVAIQTIPVPDWESVTQEFTAGPDEELRAAHLLHTFTSHRPRQRDRDGRQGAVDIVLDRADGGREVVEVTSTTDNVLSKDFSQTGQLATEIAQLYAGRTEWALHFGRGWSTSANRRERRKLAKSIAVELTRLDIEGRSDAVLESAPWIDVRQESRGGARVWIAGWNANIPDGGEQPYLDRLTDYLATSPLIAKKREKLAREALELDASARHLYLLLAATGEHGGLSPSGPADFTWGNFVAPEGISDLWLDSGSWELYHWDKSTGWRFHRLRDQEAARLLFGEQ